MHRPSSDAIQYVPAGVWFAPHRLPSRSLCSMPTQKGSANPGLTIQSLAARTADYLIAQGEAIFSSDKRDMTPPPIRKDLAVKDA